MTAALLAFGLGSNQVAAENIRVGEIHSFSTAAAFAGPSKNGSELALEEINTKGGVLGRKLELVYRDDASKPGNAVLAAEELRTKEKVTMLSGTLFSHIGLAVSDYAKQNKMLFMASEPLTDAIVWSKGNHYTFRIRPSTYMQASMLAAEAAKTPAKRWAIIAPNFEYGKSVVAAFKERLSALRPDVVFVGELWPALDKVDAGAAVQAIEAMKPDGIFNAQFLGPNNQFIREGLTRNLFKDRVGIAPLLGEPDYLELLGGDIPEGWIVTGGPPDDVKTPEYIAFANAYKAKFGKAPYMGSLTGYVTVKAIAVMMTKAGSTDTEKMIAALKGMKMDTPLGPITFREIDHQSTMGAWVGKLKKVDGKGKLVDSYYAKGEDFQPSDETVRKLRPKD